MAPGPVSFAIGRDTAGSGRDQALLDLGATLELEVPPTDSAADITRYGGWRAYLAATAFDEATRAR